MHVLESLGSCFSSRKLPQYAAAIIANLMTISYGFVAGWSSPSLQLLKNEETAIGEPITEEQETWLGSLIHLSAFLSSPVYSYINQNWGRKIAGYLSAAPLIIGWFLIIIADSVLYLYIARFLMGLSMCGINVFVVMYIGEISEDGIRGTLGTLRGVGADTGILLIYGLAPYLPIQTMAIISIALPLLFIILYYFIPESPMFLLSKGKRTEAKNAFLWLRGGDVNSAEEEVKKMDVVVEVISRKVSLKELLSVRGTRNALLIAVVFAVVIQFSGMYVICSYAARLFELSGSTMPSDIASIVIAAITIVGSLLALVGTDIAGRRIILISSQIVEGLSLGGLGIYLFAKHHGIDVTDVGILPVIFLSLYCLCVAAGVATLAYVVVAEIFRPEARGLAMSVMSTVVWGLAFVTTKFHHDLETVIGLHGCFLVYCVITLAGALFTYIRVPETKNRSLDSILRELNGDPPLGGGNI
ncbi:Facilitated trehalose transporter Tret1 [Blattella germanica]|nr:Facilitated trehalose transporter Tret1 [Blattella germanica]